MKKGEEEISKELSLKIKSLRLLKGITQRDMAKKLNTTLYLYAEMENKPLNIKIKDFVEIASLLDSELYEFFLEKLNTKCVK